MRITRIRKWITAIQAHPLQAKLFFAVFFIVGIVGTVFQPTQNWFLQLNPLAILLSLAAFFVYHAGWFTGKGFSAMICIVVFGYLIEVSGTNTGFPFGNYSYLEGLGPKVMNTPLLIGLNWLMLVIASSAVSEHLKTGNTVRVIFASAVMVGYDFFLEPVAPVLKMWEWHGESVPLSNYISWFLISLAMNAVYRYASSSVRNPIAGFVLASHVIYFIAIGFFL